MDPYIEQDICNTPTKDMVQTYFDSNGEEIDDIPIVRMVSPVIYIGDDKELKRG